MKVPQDEHPGIFRESSRNDDRVLGSRKATMKGSGDFSIGSKVWPGTSKLIEEMGELQQVLGKLIASHGDPAHWSGDLRAKLVEEIADVRAAMSFFCELNVSRETFRDIDRRTKEKWELFLKWHNEQSVPTPPNVEHNEWVIAMPTCRMCMAPATKSHSIERYCDTHAPLSALDLQYAHLIRRELNL